MAHDVFISYSSLNKAVADSVCASLESRKIRCWIAPRDMPSDLPWAGSLVRAISQARVFVLVLSHDADRSKQVLREVAQAIEMEIPIVPLRIEEVILTEEMDYYLKVIHWLDAVTPPLEPHLQALAGRVAELLATPAQGAAPGAAPHSVPPRKTWQQRLAACEALWGHGEIDAAVECLSELAIAAQPEAPETGRLARENLLSILGETEPARLPPLTGRVIAAEQAAVLRLLAGMQDPAGQKEAWDLCSAIYADASPRVREVLAREAYVDGDREIGDRTRALLAWSALASRVSLFALAYDKPEVGSFLVEALQHLHLASTEARECLIRVLAGAWAGERAFERFDAEVVPALAGCLGQMGLTIDLDDPDAGCEQVGAILRSELLRMGKGALWTVVRELVGQGEAPRDASPACWPETAGVLHSVVREMGDARFAWPILEHCRTIRQTGYPAVAALEGSVRSLVPDSALAGRLLERFGQQTRAV